MEAIVPLNFNKFHSLGQTYVPELGQHPDCLDLYLKEIANTPLLNAEEEKHFGRLQALIRIIPCLTALWMIPQVLKIICSMMICSIIWNAG